MGSNDGGAATMHPPEQCADVTTTNSTYADRLNTEKIWDAPMLERNFVDLNNHFETLETMIREGISHIIIYTKT